MRIARKIFKYLGITVLVAIAGFTILKTFFGLRVELYGSTKPHFSFYKPEQHFAALDKSRAEQKVVPVTSGAPPVPAEPGKPEVKPSSALSPRHLHTGRISAGRVATGYTIKRRFVRPGQLKA